MIKVFYEVHSDSDENNVMETFSGKGAKGAAIAYAKRNKEELTWVDKISHNESTDEYEYYGAVWCYDWED